MKRRWQQLAARIDALNLRERVLVFAAIAGVIVMLAYLAGLGPVLQKQVTLRAQISQQQNNLTGMDAEIAQKLKEFQRDPDAATRARLASVKSDAAQLGETLRAMQKGLVAPERMAPLIDAILRANGRLKLVSMRTLPVTSLNEPPPGEAEAAKKDEPSAQETVKLEAIRKSLIEKAAGSPGAGGASAQRAVEPKPGSLLYRHGVELTVRGNYLDMIDYMTALEALPTQLFWGGAKLEVEEYPTARLTLTMYTLSLDQKWLKL